jgi:hypothetical protein
VIATPMRPKKKVREQMLAYIGLTSADGTIVDDEAAEQDTLSTNCRVTIVPGRVLVAPTRGARHHGLEPQDYGWPAIAMVDAPSRFGSETSTIYIDRSGVITALHVHLAPDDLQWALSESGFRVVNVPYGPCARNWVHEDLQPLLPVSLFDVPSL